MTKASSRAMWLTTIMGTFAVVWVFWGTSSLRPELALSAIAAALVISILVAVVAVRGAKNNPTYAASARPNLKLYWGSVIFEVAAAVIGLNWLGQIGQDRFSMPFLASIVGIHFFGVGAAFHTSRHFWIGGAMCALALLALIWLPPAHPNVADTVNVCDLVVGLGCAVILWTFALVSASPGLTKGSDRDAAIRSEPRG